MILIWNEIFFFLSQSELSVKSELLLQVKRQTLAQHMHFDKNRFFLFLLKLGRRLASYPTLPGYIWIRLCTIFHLSKWMILVARVSRCAVWSLLEILALIFCEGVCCGGFAGCSIIAFGESIVGVVGGVGCEAHFSVGETARAICITNR